MRLIPLWAVALPKSNGAGDGVRTRDLHLGKVPLYQLSHSRITLAEIIPQPFTDCKFPFR